MSIVDGISQAVSRTTEFISKTAQTQKSQDTAATKQNAPQAAAVQQDTASLSEAANQISAAQKEEQTAQSQATISSGASQQAYSQETASEDVTALASRMSESSETTAPDGDKVANYTVLSGSQGDDTITISKGQSGGLNVNVNGEDFTYTSAEARNLIIDGGNGNDKINVDEDVQTALHLTGGNGNDTINGGAGKDIIIDNYDSNTINGGAGNDEITANGNSSEKKGFWKGLWEGLTGTGDTPANKINGGEGDDYIEGGFGDDKINGGEGDDYIYGLSGNDNINGGAGHDYIDGGKGNDSLNGGADQDDIFGGRGNDKINGGQGNDVIAGGRGKDTVNGGEGADNITETTGLFNKDTISSDADDSVSQLAAASLPGRISVSGTDAFKERAGSDLETMSTTKVGQQMFEAIRDEGHSLDIVDTDAGSVCCSYTTGTVTYDENNQPTNGKGADSTVHYNTSSHNMYNDRETWSEHAPITTLHHEMTHAYNYGLGNLDSAAYDDYTMEHIYNEDGSYSTDKDLGPVGGEYQAVGGLGNPNVADNPEGVNENSMRNYLGYEKREYYWPTPQEAKQASN